MRRNRCILNAKRMDTRLFIIFPRSAGVELVVLRHKGCLSLLWTPLTCRVACPALVLKGKGVTEGEDVHNT